MSTPLPPTGSRASAMLFARNGLKHPRYSAGTCGNKHSWLPIFSSSISSSQGLLFKQSYQKPKFAKAVNTSRPVPRTRAVIFMASQSFSSCEQATRVSVCCRVLHEHFLYLKCRRSRQFYVSLFCFTNTLKSIITKLLWDMACN